MEKMKLTAKRLDIFFHVLQVAVTVAAVASLAGICAVGAFFLFQLKPEQVATGYHSLDLGFLELELAASAVPEPGKILTIAAANMALGFIACTLYWVFVKCIRQILNPMKEGQPFQGIIAPSLKKLALYTLILGIVSNCMDCINLLLVLHCYDLTHILVSGSVTHVNVIQEFDLAFVAISGMLLLLSYVFRYGEELQQLSDETL